MSVGWEQPTESLDNITITHETDDDIPDHIIVPQGPVGTPEPMHIDLAPRMTINPADIMPNPFPTSTISTQHLTSPSVGQPVPSDDPLGLCLSSARSTEEFPPSPPVSPRNVQEPLALPPASRQDTNEPGPLSPPSSPHITEDCPESPLISGPASPRSTKEPPVPRQNIEDNSGWQALSSPPTSPPTSPQNLDEDTEPTAAPRFNTAAPVRNLNYNLRSVSGSNIATVVGSGNKAKKTKRKQLCIEPSGPKQVDDTEPASKRTKIEHPFGKYKYRSAPVTLGGFYDFRRQLVSSMLCIISAVLNANRLTSRRLKRRRTIRNYLNS